MVAAAVVLVVPIVALVLYDAPEIPNAVAPVDGPSVAVVGLSSVRSAGSATMVATWSTDGLVVAPGWSGLVTEVRLTTGGRVKSGDIVATVDGISRLAIQTDLPFHRALGETDRGPDVVALQEVLMDLGFAEADSVVDGVFGRRTREAVRRLAQAIGVPAGPESDAFDAGWFVWIDPSTPVDPIIGDVAIEVGQPAPAPGAVLARTEPRLESVAFTAPSLDLVAETEWSIARSGDAGCSPNASRSNA